MWTGGILYITLYIQEEDVLSVTVGCLVSFWLTWSVVTLHCLSSKSFSQLAKHLTSELDPTVGTLSRVLSGESEEDLPRNPKSPIALSGDIQRRVVGIT